MQILSIVDISKDAIHIYIGLLVFFIWIIITKKPLKSFISVIPVFVVALFMEMLDSRDDYNTLGFVRWKESIHDIFNTCIWPVIIVLLSKFKFIKTEK